MNIKHGSREPYATIYPVLLLLSTGMAAVFCFLYLSKPAVTVATMAVATPAPTSPASVASTPVTATKSSSTTSDKKPDAIAPSTHQLPGDVAKVGVGKPTGVTGGNLPNIGLGSPFEETNMRVQHILTAETPTGDLSRIVLDVPVLLKSGTLAWSADDVNYARELLKHLTAHQEKTQALRDEGVQLLKAWNYLVEKTVPMSILRADSPSLPSNQKSANWSAKPSNLDTKDAIQIQPSNP